jgi:mono/diheme cytochrome c family protein
MIAALSWILVVAAQAATIWSGVYTLEQSERGQKAYGRSCGTCHRDDLSGSDDGAPALKGAVFFERWKDRPLSEMYFVIAETMPQDAPGSLSAAEYADIISFLLRRNDAPAGEMALPTDLQKLKRIVVVEKP